jgi:adenylylsulfate kinase-like enzyme
MRRAKVGEASPVPGFLTWCRWISPFSVQRHQAREIADPQEAVRLEVAEIPPQEGRPR